MSCVMVNLNIIIYFLHIKSYHNYFVIFNRFGVDQNSTAVENVYCSYSNYLSISQCSLSSQYSSNCSSDSYDLVVTCCKFLCVFL